MESIDKINGIFERKANDAPKTAVSAAVIKRLPRYHRYLGDLLREGKMRISSSELSAIMNVTASQIRQDLNCFGGFGQQGYGYNIRYLHGKISELLGVTDGFGAVIVGAGNLGHALATTHMFERRGVRRLALFDTKPELVDNAAAYIRIVFMGLPFAALFSFSDIALRARGQGAKSSAVIVMAGIINVALNILFVSVFKMTVRGVAIATVMSQAFSAAANLILLYRDEESIAFRIKRIHINPKRLGEIVKIGVPSSVNAIVTSLASMVTVSAFNSLPLDVIRADAAAGSAVTIFNLTMSAFTWSAITVVVAQNVGARNYKRIRSTMVYASAVISVIALIFIPVYLIFSKTVISLFYDSSLAGFETIVSLARPIFIPLCINVVFAGFTTIIASTSRAIGHPVTPLVISFVALSFNVSWCLFVFPHYGTPIMYYLYIPISVTLELIIHVITNSIYRARLKKEFSKDPAPTATPA